MNKTILKSLLCLIFISLISGCCSVNKSNFYTAKSNEVSLPMFSHLTIDLPCSPSTGYSWMLIDRISQTNLVFVNQTFNSNPGDSGDSAKGVQHFHFEAADVGQTQLRFIHIQPFNKFMIPEKIRSTNFTVTILAGWSKNR